MQFSGHEAVEVTKRASKPASKVKLLRVVLDTNIVLSALKFPSGALAELRKMWQAGRFVPVASRPMLEELMRVFAYPRFKLTDQDQQKLLADYLPYVEVLTATALAGEKRPQTASLPLCRDEKDQMFLQAAYFSKADWLVTGDQDLLILANQVVAGQASFGICTAAELFTKLTH